jgi:2,3-bisphosphoglycerate-dependent phosphoglycerate mutase
VAVTLAGETVVVVTHGGPLNAVYNKATGQPAKFKMANCAVNEVHISGSAWAGTAWNDVEHLQGVGFMSTAVGGGSSGG